jgi:hypothetical protein
MKLSRTALLACSLVLLLPPSAATASGATVVSVADASTTDLLSNNEITISHNPLNSANLVIGDNDYALNDGCGVGYSTDGGATWSAHAFIPGITRVDNSGNSYPGAGIYDFAGDPAVAFGPDGTAYFACYGYLVHGTFSKVALFVSASHDGGATWGTPHQVTSCDCSGYGKGAGNGGNGQFPDHEAITVDTGTGAGHHPGRIYIAQAQFHGGNGPSAIQLFSSDNGTSWSKPIAVSHSPLSSNQDAIPFVGPDGSVYVTFDNEHGTSSSNGKSYVEGLYVAASHDGGQSFGADYPVIDWVSPVNRDLANTPYRVGSYGAPGIDAQGRITVVYNDRRSGPSNVWYVRARAADLSHGRAAWTAPTQLEASPHQQFFPWVSVAPGGRVDVVYYDRTLDPQDFISDVTYTSLTPTAGLAVAVSSVNVSPVGFDGSVATGSTTTSCGSFAGDYIGITSTDSDVYLGWTGNGSPYHFDELGHPVSCDVNEDDFAGHLTP